MVYLPAALEPTELFVSGRADGPYVRQGVEVVADLHSGCGPLGGLEAACWRMQTPLLCVLAIDLPWMTSQYLSRLVAEAQQTGCGVVPCVGEDFEPLAAVYPSTMYPLIAEQLNGADHSLQGLVRRAVEKKIVVPYPIAEGERALFRNVNTPEDLERA